MSSWSASTRTVGDAQDVILYRREPLRSPDEVLSEARKNHTIFKANVVTGGLRPSSRHIGLSRFQFGDGEYAASVESMQRFIAEKAGRQEPLPDLQEPVQLTRTLSRSLSSSRNPFRAASRTKLRPDVDAAAVRAATSVAKEILISGGGGGRSRLDSPTETDQQTARDGTVGPPSPGGGHDAEQAQPPGHLPDSEGTATASGSGGHREAVRRRSTSNSFTSLPSGLTQSFRSVQPPPPPPLDVKSYWSAGGSGSGSGGWDDGGSDRDGKDSRGGDDNGDGDDDGGDAGYGSGGGVIADRRRRLTSPANAFASFTYRGSYAACSDADSNEGGHVWGPSSSCGNPFVRRNSLHIVGGAGATADSPTGRVDQLLRNLRRLKVTAPAAATAKEPGCLVGGASPHKRIGAAAGAIVNARFSNGSVSGGSGGSGGGGGSSAMRVSFNGSGRSDSTKDFGSRGRSATTTHLPDDSGEVSAGGVSGCDEADPKTAAPSPHPPQVPPHTHRPRTPSLSQPQLQLQLPLASSASGSPSLTPSGTSSPMLARTHGTPPGALAVPGGSASLTSGGAAAGGGGGGGGGGGPGGSGGGSQGAMLYHRITRSPTGEGDRAGAYPQSPFSSQMAATAAATAPSSPAAIQIRPKSAMVHSHGLGAGGAAAAVMVATPPPGSPSGPGPLSRSSSRKLMTEGSGPHPGSGPGPAAGAGASNVRASSSGAPLGGWSSRSGHGVRSHASVGNFFANLLSTAASPGGRKSDTSTTAV